MFGTKVDLTEIRTSSKDALKRSLMNAYGNDIDTMQKMYDFYMKDMESLPDFDIARPSQFEQIKEGVLGTLKWADSNQDKILGYISLFKQLKSGQVTSVPTNVPPIP